MTTTQTEQKDPKDALQELADALVAMVLSDDQSATAEEWQAFIKTYEDDCEKVGADAATLLIATTAHICVSTYEADRTRRAKLRVAPTLPFSKLRPKVR